MSDFIKSPEVAIGEIEALLKIYKGLLKAMYPDAQISVGQRASGSAEHVAVTAYLWVDVKPRTEENSYVELTVEMNGVGVAPYLACAYVAWEDGLVIKEIISMEPGAPKLGYSDETFSKLLDRMPELFVAMSNLLSAPLKSRG